MKVYIGLYCWGDGLDWHDEIVKVFDDEVKAIIWQEEFVRNEFEHRDYIEVEVE